MPVPPDCPMCHVNQVGTRSRMCRHHSPLNICVCDPHFPPRFWARPGFLPGVSCVQALCSHPLLLPFFEIHCPFVWNCWKEVNSSVEPTPHQQLCWAVSIPQRRCMPSACLGTCIVCKQCSVLVSHFLQEVFTVWTAYWPPNCSEGAWDCWSHGWCHHPLQRLQNLSL